MKLFRETVSRDSLIINLMALDTEISDVTFGHLSVTLKPSCKAWQENPV